ncbi:hypothetical protein BJ912DRAFT_924503 [Pholiota molesta]|nr:hypothetical protein BJ912DRAFT_924503 [Pholiota molesta]
MTAAIYRFLVTDYLNPLALPTGGAGSGKIFTYDITTVLIQLFFCWRIWIFSGVAFTLAYRIAFLMLTIRLLGLIGTFELWYQYRYEAIKSILKPNTSSHFLQDTAIAGFNHRLLTENTPQFILAFKLATTSQVAFDVIMTVAMNVDDSAHSSSCSTNIRSTKHVMVIIMLFAVNSNLLST